MYNLLPCCFMKNGVRRKAQGFQVLCKAILGRVKPLCDELIEVVEVLADIVSGVIKISMHVIEAGTEVQLPDHSKNVETWLWEHGKHPVIYNGYTGPEQLMMRLGMQFLKLCPWIWNGDSSKIWGILKLTVGITRLQSWKSRSRGWKPFSCQTAYFKSNLCSLGCRHAWAYLTDGKEEP